MLAATTYIDVEVVVGESEFHRLGGTLLAVEHLGNRPVNLDGVAFLDALVTNGGCVFVGGGDHNLAGRFVVVNELSRLTFHSIRPFAGEFLVDSVRRDKLSRAVAYRIGVYRSECNFPLVCEGNNIRSLAICLHGLHYRIIVVVKFEYFLIFVSFVVMNGFGLLTLCSLSYRPLDGLAAGGNAIYSGIVGGAIRDTESRAGSVANGKRLIVGISPLECISIRIMVGSSKGVSITTDRNLCIGAIGVRLGGESGVLYGKFVSLRTLGYRAIRVAIPYFPNEMISTCGSHIGDSQLIGCACIYRPVLIDPYTIEFYLANLSRGLSFKRPLATSLIYIKHILSHNSGSTVAGVEIGSNKFGCDVAVLDLDRLGLRITSILLNRSCTRNVSHYIYYMPDEGLAVGRNIPNLDVIEGCRCCSRNSGRTYSTLLCKYISMIACCRPITP